MLRPFGAPCRQLTNHCLGVLHPSTGVEHQENGVISRSARPLGPREGAHEHGRLQLDPRRPTGAEHRPHHAQPAREAQRHLDAVAGRVARRAAVPRPRSRRAGDDHPRRRCLLLCGLRPRRWPDDGRRPVLQRAGRRAVGPPVQRHVVQHLGPGQAGHRPDPRLRDRGATELASACDLVYIADDATISGIRWCAS